MNPLKKKFTKALIEEMARSLTQRKIKPLRTELSKRINENGNAIYTHVYGEQTVARMQEVPEGWMATTRSCNVDVVNSNGELTPVAVSRFMGRHYVSEHRIQTVTQNRLNLDLSKAMPITAEHRYRTIGTVLANHPLIKTYQALTEEDALLAQDEQDFEEQMTNTLTTCGNFFKLYEQWPEVRELLRSFEPETLAPRLLPALPIAQLNKELGIPEEKAA